MLVLCYTANVDHDASFPVTAHYSLTQKWKTVHYSEGLLIKKCS